MFCEARGLDMLVYTVTKPVGTKDKEFEAYTRLLGRGGDRRLEFTEGA